jgi:hypothetical protein
MRSSKCLTQEFYKGNISQDNISVHGLFRSPPNKNFDPQHCEMTLWVNDPQHCEKHSRLHSTNKGRSNFINTLPLF